MGKVTLFVVKAGLGGLVSYAAPRALIAAGFPLDEWIAQIVGAVSLEAAAWSATVAIASLLFFADLASRHFLTPRAPALKARNVKLPDLLRYLGYQSKWAARRNPMFDGEWVKDAYKEINCRMSLGDLEATGQFRNDQTKVYHSGYRPIPASVWETAKWDAATVYFKNTYRHIEQQSGYDVYADVSFKAEDVLRVWPKRSLWDALWQKSPAERSGAHRKWRAANHNLDKNNEFYWKPL